MKLTKKDQQTSIKSFFTPKAISTEEKQSQGGDDSVPASKRRKTGRDTHSNVIVIDDDDDSPTLAALPVLKEPTSGPPTVQNYDPPCIPSQRNAAAHFIAQAKLAPASSTTTEQDLGSEQQQQPGPVKGSSRKPQAPKYTPLEQQVVALKAAHPAVLLVVEVGYKMRLFGEDAEVAARELGLFCYMDHNFMTASFPVPRWPIHVRRLVAAGHKVGVVRQTESAALKAAGDNKGAPFTRSLTGLYTAATLEAAEKADKLDEATFMEASQELEAVLGGSGPSSRANCILVVAEQLLPVHGHQQPPPPQQQQQGHLSSSSAVPAASASCGQLGVLVVDVGSGDVAYGLCSNCGSSSSSSSKADSPGVGGSSGGGGTRVMPLEAVLLSLLPAEVIVCEPVSPATEQLLNSYVAGASRKCRMEHLSPQQWRHQQHQQHAGLSESSEQREGRQAAAGGSGSYLDAAVLKVLTDFFLQGSNEGDNQQRTAAGAATALGAAEASSSSKSDDLRFILSMPQPVLAAVAGALAYLAPFGLSGVLRCTASFRPLDVGCALVLDGNVLRQLEIMEAGAEGARGSLLHLLDRCSTAAGGRLLRRWLAAPLADRNMILDRQQAVQVLLDSTQGSAHQQQPSSSSSSEPLLQQLPRWLSGARQDLERALARVAAGTSAPAEAVGLWKTLSQVPVSLHLPLKAQQSAASGGRELDLDELAARVPSRLLVTLLAAAAGPGVSGSAAEVLTWLDVAAATKNDYLTLFQDQQRFPEVFACKEQVSDAKAHLEGLLPRLAASAGVSSLSYVTIQNQGNYLVELPATRTNVPSGWDKVCATKKVCRYHPSEVKEGMAALARAQELLQAACAAAWSELLSSFTAAHHAAFREAVAAVAQLDALHALAVVAASPGYCRPKFAEDGEAQQLVITDGKHPMLDLSLEGAAVPNSINLSWDATRAAIITGPNMGGKSVLMRQAAVTVIMAQLGSWVPASSCVLSVFDGVYCRMGASDCLMLGRSTFAEELGEASQILAAATRRSLVIMDELGRGTATHDGVAIACATLSHLVSHTQCLSLFVTHYPEVAALAHSSSSNNNNNSRSDAAATEAAASAGQDAAIGAAAGHCSTVESHVAAYHMSFVRHDPAPPSSASDSGAEASASSCGAAAAEAAPVITFLYKLAEGAADESFGLNVATMAGLPTTVVQRAAVIAKQLKSRLGPTSSSMVPRDLLQEQQPPAEPGCALQGLQEQQQEQQQERELRQVCQQVYRQLVQLQSSGPGVGRELQDLQLSVSELLATS